MGQHKWARPIRIIPEHHGKMQHQQHQPEPAIGMDVGRLRSETKTRQQGLCGLLAQLGITLHGCMNSDIPSFKLTGDQECSSWASG